MQNVSVELGVKKPVVLLGSIKCPATVVVVNLRALRVDTELALRSSAALAALVQVVVGDRTQLFARSACALCFFFYFIRHRLFP